MNDRPDADPKPRYTWPWFVLGAFVLAVVLAVLWMSVLVRRVHQQRESDPFAVPAQTNR